MSASPSETLTGAEKTLDKTQKKTLVINNHKVIEFWKSPKESLRATVCAINGGKFIGLSKFGYNETWKNWYPRAKGHFYMKADQWLALKNNAGSISDSFREFTQLDEANSGTWVYYQGY
jgi:hypothetical protein